jgi:hypothetical protein
MADDLVQSKLALAARLVALRSEIYGERGGPEMARRLNIPVRTWYNYEKGITIPAEIILRVIKLTGVEAAWLLDGTGSMVADPRSRSEESAGEASPPEQVVGTLLRTALHLLEQSGSGRSRSASPYPSPGPSYGSHAAIAIPPAVPLQPPQRGALDGRWSDDNVTAHADGDRTSRRRQA